MIYNYARVAALFMVQTPLFPWEIPLFSVDFWNVKWAIYPLVSWRLVAHFVRTGLICITLWTQATSKCRHWAVTWEWGCLVAKCLRTSRCSSRNLVQSTISQLHLSCCAHRQHIGRNMGGGVFGSPRNFVGSFSCFHLSEKHGPTSVSHVSC